MEYFELEPLKSQYDEIQDAVSNATREDGKTDSVENAAGENEKKSMKFIPENDTRIYTFSRDKEFVSILG